MNGPLLCPPGGHLLPWHVQSEERAGRPAGGALQLCFDPPLSGLACCIACPVTRSRDARASGHLTLHSNAWVRCPPPHRSGARASPPAWAACCWARECTCQAADPGDQYVLGEANAGAALPSPLSQVVCPASLAPLTCSAPLVHSGFLQAYTANGFNERLLSRCAGRLSALRARICTLRQLRQTSCPDQVLCQLALAYRSPHS